MSRFHNLVTNGSVSSPQQYQHLVSRVAEYNGEQWRVFSVTNHGSEFSVSMNIVNVPGEAVRNEILRLPLKVFLSHMKDRG